MKNLLILSLSALLALAACKSRKKNTTALSPWETKCITNDNLIIDGRGWDVFVIDSTTLDDIVKELGRDTVMTVHGIYSVQIKYPKLGIGFYYMLDKNPEKKIFTMYFIPPFNGHTLKDIKLAKSTMKEAIDQYGPAYWLTSKDADHWNNEYESHGVKFEVGRDMSLPHFPIDEKAHEKKIIRRIAIIQKKN